MECLGLSRVTIEDGKVVGVTEPAVRYCPLFAKHRGIEELNEESIRENIEYRIRTFGMCSENRETTMKDFLSFGISETLSTALSDGEIDAVVLAADGCGTSVITDPALVQGLGGRISAIRETEPIPKVVEAVGRENILDPDTAAIDMVAGAEKAFGMGYGRIAVTTASMRDVERIRAKYGDRAVIALVHTTGISAEDAEKAFGMCDLITACASEHLREVAHSRSDIVQAGSAVPVYGVTDIGKRLMLRRLEIAGKKPWDPSQKEDPPQPLLRREEVRTALSDPAMGLNPRLPCPHSRRLPADPTAGSVGSRTSEPSAFEP